MLFLRRATNDSIVLFDAHCLSRILITQVSVPDQKIQIKIDGKDLHTLRPGDTLELMSGKAHLKLSHILDYHGRYPNAASIGIKAPQSIKIHRGERLKGLGPNQIAALRAR